MLHCDAAFHGCDPWAVGEKGGEANLWPGITKIFRIVC
jgi:hypothetical protein